MIPVVAFVGHSGSGKTTLLRRLIGILKQRGHRVGALKHTHHAFEIDRPGKDSFELKAAGAEAVGIWSDTQLGLVRDVCETTAISKIVQRYFVEMDIVLAEGFSQHAIPHIAILGDKTPLPRVSPLIGIVSDMPMAQPAGDASFPRFGFDEIDKLADFLESEFLK
jgi:molybdopterin-guanine dinucleotide biosynthesis protein B